VAPRLKLLTHCRNLRASTPAPVSSWAAAMTRIVVFLLATRCSLAAPAAELSNDDLAKRCDQKTFVYNKQGQRVGEDIDGFCSGYLQATLQALLNTPTIKCTSSLIGNQTPESLLAIYRRYRKETAASGLSGATPTLVAAFQRAFDCEAH
jgi:hypothetical protein